MKRKVLAIFLSLLILAPQMMQAGLVVHYSLNIEAIEEAYCVNKDLPELECHGSCHLKTQLAQVTSPQGDSPSENPTPPINLRVSVYDFQDIDDFGAGLPLFDSATERLPETTQNTLSGFHTLITPPPRSSD